MIAARLHDVGDLRVAVEAGPGEPPPGWSLLAVTSVGICGSDLHWFVGAGPIGVRPGGARRHSVRGPVIVSRRCGPPEGVDKVVVTVSTT
ncbi:MAG: L-iditol 2-dehydrogenase [Mycobacterium sp.]|jgi:threonine dehydrogenase-like Zn-dependent dehydrogenase|nr:L-iditol 2-dehydrogenase [Mycobacterium sp.]MDT5323494.1 L-iditol 2-dehydrogenase [Mycobacterium sp.]